MRYKVIDNENVDYLDPILVKDGLFSVVDYSVLKDIPQKHLTIWGNKNGIYCFPTTELIDWLKEKIGNQSAIEICSGTGVIGRALGITRTDSYIQTSPEMIALYTTYGQKPIFPPDDVLKFEANEAVDRFKPKVVIGSYVTQRAIPGDSDEGIGSSIYGTDELSLLKKVETYITIGNDISHGDKRIRKFSHTIYRFPWILTRSLEPNKNFISVWEKT